MNLQHCADPGADVSGAGWPDNCPDGFSVAEIGDTPDPHRPSVTGCRSPCRSLGLQSSPFALLQSWTRRLNAWRGGSSGGASQINPVCSYGPTLSSHPGFEWFFSSDLQDEPNSRAQQDDLWNPM